MLSRKFSNREKALLLILALLVIAISYYLLVWKPVNERMEAAVSAEANAQNEMLLEQAKLAQMQQMKAELASLDAFEQSTNAAVIPPYDNAKKVMQLLNGVLMASQKYSIDFSNVSMQGNLALRSLRMSFECGSYNDAKAIIRALYSGPYRCRIGNMTFRSAAGNMLASPVAVELDITFYEFLETLEAQEDEETLALEDAQ